LVEVSRVIGYTFPAIAVITSPNLVVAQNYGFSIVIKVEAAVDTIGSPSVRFLNSKTGSLVG
jgi:hypothetical protein